MWFLNTIVNKFIQKINNMAQGNSTEVICLDDSDDSTVPENKGIIIDK